MADGRGSGIDEKLTGEKRMYPPVSKVFEDLGYMTVRDDFAIEPYEDYDKRVDVLAYRWMNSSLETIAVECKDNPPPQGVVDGLSQAMLYSLYFDDVYIATTPGEDLEVLELTEKLNPVEVWHIEIQCNQAGRINLFQKFNCFGGILQ